MLKNIFSFFVIILISGSLALAAETKNTPCIQLHDHEKDHPHDHEDEHDHAEDYNDEHEHEHQHDNAVQVTVPVTAQKSLALSYETADPSHGAPLLVIFGQWEIPAHAMVSYSLPVSGQIYPYARPAQHVNKGDKLFSVNSPELIALYTASQEATAEVNRAQAELEILSARINTLLSLKTKNAELETSFEAKKAELETLKVKSINTYRQFISASGGGIFKDGMNGTVAPSTLGAGTFKDNMLTFYAEQSGIVGSLNKSTGAWAQAGEQVLIIAPTNQLEFIGTTYSGIDMQHVRAQLVMRDMEHTVKLDGTLRISGNVDTEKSTRQVYFTPKELPDTAYAGQQVQLEIYPTDEQTDGYCYIPQGAVVRVGIDDVVFIKDKDHDDTFFMVKVSTLPTKRGLTPVKGLHPGDIIVTRGANELKYAVPAEEGAKKKSPGHFHADGQFHEGQD